MLEQAKLIASSIVALITQIKPPDLTISRINFNLAGTFAAFDNEEQLIAIKTTDAPNARPEDVYDLDIADLYSATTNKIVGTLNLQLVKANSTRDNTLTIKFKDKTVKPEIAFKSAALDFNDEFKQLVQVPDLLHEQFKQNKLDIAVTTDVEQYIDDFAKRYLADLLVIRMVMPAADPDKIDGFALNNLINELTATNPNLVLLNILNMLKHGSLDETELNSKCIAMISKINADLKPDQAEFNKS